MIRTIKTAGFFLFACLLINKVYAQDSTGKKKVVESVNGLFALQVGVPTGSMQNAIKNNMGNLGVGGVLSVLFNPFTWGKTKRNGPLRVGVEGGYTYYGRFISDVNINGFRGDYKTSYGILQLNAVLQVRPKEPQFVTPFFELLAGGSFYFSEIKENLNLIETSLGVESFGLDGYSSSSFNKGAAVGFSIGKLREYVPGKFSPRFTMRFSYNRGNTIKYVERNSLVFNTDNNRLEYEVGRAPVRYFLIQAGIGF